MTIESSWRRLLRSRAGWAGAALFALVAVVDVLPSAYSWFVLHSQLKVAGACLLGVFRIIELFPVVVDTARASLLGVARTQPEAVTVAVVLFMAAAGLVFGSAVGRLWTRGVWWRLGAVMLVAVNSSIGYGCTFITGTLAWPAEVACERAIDEQRAIRVVMYPKRAIFPEAEYFYLVTQDGGQTWQQFMTVSYDWEYPDCVREGERIGVQGGQFIWTWTCHSLCISRDGGTTWQRWDGACTNASRLDYARIEAVQFDDKWHGEMRLSGRKDAEAIVLYTEDGGLTWDAR